MMRRKSTPLCLLIEEDHRLIAGWRESGDQYVYTSVQADGHQDEKAHPQAMVQRLAEKLRSELPGTPPGGGILRGAGVSGVGIPSSWCLCASVVLDEMTLKAGQSAWDCLFEAKLPVALESVVTSYMPTSDPHRLLGVAVLLDRLQPWVDALEAAGFAVDHMVPSAALAMQFAQHECVNTQDESWQDATWVLPGVAGMDQITLEQGKLKQWRFKWSGSSTDPNDKDEINFDECFDQKLMPEWHHASGNTSEETGETLPPVTQASLLVGLQVAAGESEPWWDLRQGALATTRRYAGLVRELKRCAVAACVGLLLLTGVMQWRTSQLHQRAEHDRNQTIAAYRQVAGEQARIPLSLSLRMQTLLREQQGQASIAAASQTLIGSQDATDLLVHTLSRIPTDRRWLLVDQRITADQFDLVGQARHHSDAGYLAKRLAADGLLKVDEPQTHRLRDQQGIGFTLSGIRVVVPKQVAPQTPPQPNAMVQAKGHRQP